MSHLYHHVLQLVNFFSRALKLIVGFHTRNVEKNELRIDSKLLMLCKAPINQDFSTTCGPCTVCVSFQREKPEHWMLTFWGAVYLHVGYGILGVVFLRSNISELCKGQGHEAILSAAALKQNRIRYRPMTMMWISCAWDKGWVLGLFLFCFALQGENMALISIV